MSQSPDPPTAAQAASSAAEQLAEDRSSVIGIEAHPAFDRGLEDALRDLA